MHPLVLRFLGKKIQTHNVFQFDVFTQSDRNTDEESICLKERRRRALLSESARANTTDSVGIVRVAADDVVVRRLYTVWKNTVSLNQGFYLLKACKKQQDLNLDHVCVFRPYHKIHWTFVLEFTRWPYFFTHSTSNLESDLVKFPRVPYINNNTIAAAQN